MLEIHECSDYRAYSAQLEKIDVLCPVIVESYDGDKITGYGIYSCEPEKAVVYDFSDTDDLYLLDGIIRTMLFKASVMGIEYAEFDVADEHKRGLLEKLKYSRTIESLSEFFSGCKNCSGFGMDK